MTAGVADDYNRIGSSMYALGTQDNTDICKFFLRVSELFDKTRTIESKLFFMFNKNVYNADIIPKIEARISADEDLKLSDLLKYYLRESQAAKDLLYRRSRSLVDYENANKALDKARAKNKDVLSAETTQQLSCQKFEKISESAKQGEAFSDAPSDDDSDLVSEQTSNMRDMVQSLIVAVNHTFSIKDTSTEPADQVVSFRRSKPPSNVFAPHKEFEECQPPGGSSIHPMVPVSPNEGSVKQILRVNIGLLSAALRLVTRCLPWLPGDFGIVGRWRAVCVTALQRPNSDAAAIRIVVGIAAASLSVKGP
ncbi:unnamed protein product [Ranitomeya imitator]|uniref:Uncharacterized protein n=1 Tax=Ranitomeya imitator TaxID=111125 RepID=A0ABN9M4L5_9NEOB|nr:unnamed protein product [Ranitomeya imitator]